MFRITALLSTLTISVFMTTPAAANSYHFSTGAPDGKMAMGSRPSSAGKQLVETADDFIVNTETLVNHATFVGLLPSGTQQSDVIQVDVEIYRVFPKDSVNHPSGTVPTRTNSPSDNFFDHRDSVGETLVVKNNNFTAANSVLNGIHKKPNQNTGGEGPVNGQEVLFDLTFATAFDLPADHYFFVPQVELRSGDFFWLSAPKPIGADGTPFTPDLQTWIRNSDLDPDWLRVGTDVVGNGAFNAAFSLDGTTSTAPEPSTLMLLGTGLLGVMGSVRWKWLG